MIVARRSGSVHVEPVLPRESTQPSDANQNPPSSPTVVPSGGTEPGPSTSSSAESAGVTYVPPGNDDISSEVIHRSSVQPLALAGSYADKTGIFTTNRLESQVVSVTRACANDSVSTSQCQNQKRSALLPTAPPMYDTLTSENLHVYSSLMPACHQMYGQQMSSSPQMYGLQTPSSLQMYEPQMPSSPQMQSPQTSLGPLMHGPQMSSSLQMYGVQRSSQQMFGPQTPGSQHVPIPYTPMRQPYSDLGQQVPSCRHTDQCLPVYPPTFWSRFPSCQEGTSLGGGGWIVPAAHSPSRIQMPQPGSNSYPYR